MNKKQTSGRISIGNTRYGLTGFLKAAELSPALRNLKIFNICMNYFMKNKDMDTEGHPQHCENCLSSELLEKDRLDGKDRDIIRAIIKGIKDFNKDSV
jgi:glutamine phosphoribosylpyrophosphate amidotransferase